MEEVHVPGEGPDLIYAADAAEAGDPTVAERAHAPAEATEGEEAWRYVEHEPSLLNAGFTIELRNIKTVMVIAPNHPTPISVEGLLLEHHIMPLAAEMELILTADDREIVRERFFLPTARRSEVMEAHRELAKMSSDFLTDSRLRDMAMTVYFPELSEEYDFWYRVSIDETGRLTYGLHMGPSHDQGSKKRIEGTLDL